MGKRKRLSKIKNSIKKDKKSGIVSKESIVSVPIFQEFDNASENGPFIPIRSLFPADYQFPPVETMKEEELVKKMDEISNTLFDHNIELSFCDNVPDKLVYNYLISEVIPEETIMEKKFEGCFTHFDGCHGVCNICFQKEYCDAKHEEV